MSGSKPLVLGLGLDDFEDGEIVSEDSTKNESTVQDLEDVSSGDVMSSDSVEPGVKTSTTDCGKKYKKNSIAKAENKNSKEKTNVIPIIKLKDMEPSTSAGNKISSRRKQKRKRIRYISISSDSSGVEGYDGISEKRKKVAIKSDSTKSRSRPRKYEKSSKVVSELVAAVSRQKCTPRNTDVDLTVPNLRMRLLNTGLLSDPGPAYEIDDVGQLPENSEHNISSHKETGSLASNISICENIVDEFVADHVPIVGTVTQTSPTLNPSVVELKFCGGEATVEQSLSLTACQQRDDDSEESIEALRENALRSSVKIGRVATQQDVGAKQDIDDLEILRMAALKSAVVGKLRVRQARKVQLAAEQKERQDLPNEFCDDDKTTVPVDMDLALSDEDELGFNQGLNDEIHGDQSKQYNPECWTPLEKQDSDHVTKCFHQDSEHLFLAVTNANSQNQLTDLPAATCRGQAVAHKNVCIPVRPNLIQIWPDDIIIRPKTDDYSQGVLPVGNIASAENESTFKVVQVVPVASGKGISHELAPTGVKKIDVIAPNQIRDNFASKCSFSAPPSHDTAADASRFGTDQLSHLQSLPKIKPNMGLSLIPISNLMRKRDETITNPVNFLPTGIPRNNFNYTGAASTSSGTGPNRKVVSTFKSDTAKRFVIKVSQDSDSEDEKGPPQCRQHLGQTVVNERVVSTTPHIQTCTVVNNNSANTLLKGPEFEKKLNALLKSSRQDHENKMRAELSLTTSKHTTEVNSMTLAASSGSTLRTAGPTAETPAAASTMVRVQKPRKLISAPPGKTVLNERLVSFLRNSTLARGSPEHTKELATLLETSRKEYKIKMQAEFPSKPKYTISRNCGKRAASLGSTSKTAGPTVYRAIMPMPQVIIMTKPQLSADCTLLVSAAAISKAGVDDTLMEAAISKAVSEAAISKVGLQVPRIAQPALPVAEVGKIAKASQANTLLQDKQVYSASMTEAAITLVGMQVPRIAQPALPVAEVGKIAKVSQANTLLQDKQIYSVSMTEAAISKVGMQVPRIAQPALPVAEVGKIAKASQANTLLEESAPALTEAAVSKAGVRRPRLDGPGLPPSVAIVKKIAKPRKAKILPEIKFARTITLAEAALSKAAFQMKYFIAKKVRPVAMFANIHNSGIAHCSEQPHIFVDVSDPQKLTSETIDSGNHFVEARCDDQLHTSTESQTTVSKTRAAPVLATDLLVPPVKKGAPAQPTGMRSFPNVIELKQCEDDLLTARIRTLDNVKYIKETMSCVKVSEVILNTQRNIIADRQRLIADARHDIQMAEAIIGKEEENGNTQVEILLKRLANLKYQLATAKNLQSSCVKCGSLVEGFQYKFPENLEAEASPGSVAVGEGNPVEPRRAHLKTAEAQESGAAQLAAASQSQPGRAQWSVPGNFRLATSQIPDTIVPTQSRAKLTKPMGYSNQRNNEVPPLGAESSVMSAGFASGPTRDASGSLHQPAPPHPLHNFIDCRIYRAPESTEAEVRAGAVGGSNVVERVATLECEVAATQASGATQQAAAIQLASIGLLVVPTQGHTASWHLPELRSSQEKATDFSSVMCPYVAVGICEDPLCLFSHSLDVN